MRLTKKAQQRGNGLKFVKANVEAATGRGLACASGSGIISFGDLGPSAEAILSIKAYFKPAAGERLELDFTGVLSVGPSWLDEVLTALRDAFGADRVLCLPSDNLSVIETSWEAPFVKCGRYSPAYDRASISNQSIR